MRCHSRHIISKVHPTQLWFMTDDVHLDPMPHFPCGTFWEKKKSHYAQLRFRSE